MEQTHDEHVALLKADLERRSAEASALAEDVMTLRDRVAELDAVAVERERRLIELNARMAVRVEGWVRRRTGRRP